MSNLLKPKKSLGQHWLNDVKTLETICSYANISDQDTVLEIGPGAGSLTKLLVQKAKEVIAVELDDTLVKELSTKVPAKNLKVIHQDILNFDFSKLEPDFKIIANIPYYLTSNLIRVLSESANQPKIVVILVQKEVAQRVAASPGGMSLLSVSAQFYWDVGLGEVVPAEMFEPAPKIDSQVLIMKRRPTKLFPDVNEKQFFQVVKSGFSNRRKTLNNSLAAGFHINKDEAHKLLEKANIDSNSRPQELSLDQWHELYKIISTNSMG